ncbi:FMN-linked oxidoreductase [Punctularia strigosozonata HHB-11173 SS5]|uniref:FMN-linked oxidoreductase n=1 Tax=Punctularia strigosozonata (strain HHB-11173) TaxID=741275 RepID=UPI0004416E62|nr:FMN-linked oxidoreductase [Punctularia strigosozonata HHB-11173 SS5]EIN14722.1 FMN-linked oxidoreductase [Punctularia strigosozonata HHB-11173 SS5]
MSSPTPKLFQEITVGDVTLKHRVALAPLTRFRADVNHVPLNIVRQYYEQRARIPGTLLISEATYIAAKAGGYNNAPGIWSDAQIDAWKKVTDAVHAQGSFIYLQLWALGRAASGDVLKSEDPSFDVVSASDLPITGSKFTPRSLTTEEVKEYVQLYATAASNAVHRAGFDGVEVHGANGYLVDQFLQDKSNKRTDEYGGSIENRAKFALEVVDAIAKAVGPTKTAIRLSPWADLQDMRLDDPIPTFSYVVQQLKSRQPDLAFIHVIEPRVKGTVDIDGGAPAGESNDFIREIWAPRPLISAGGYNRELALRNAEDKGDIIAFGRHFIANPDLPLRLEKDIPLHPYDRSTFYTPESPVGYIDQPFADQETETFVTKL